MNTTITNNNGLPKFPQATNHPGSSSASTAAPADGAAAALRNGDQLNLTNSARALQEARQTSASPVDAKRVEQIRQALADGRYKIDAGRIADRMIAMDQQLDGTGKA
ncbi:MAG: flagellar biosynthesis anti-sigma factor FlgM [Rhodanobacter sp.]